MDNEEVEFIAENELITIIPNFQYKKLYLIGVGKILFSHFQLKITKLDFLM
jgi:hypothetical protein